MELLKKINIHSISKGEHVREGLFYTIEIAELSELVNMKGPCEMNVACQLLAQTLLDSED